MYSKENTRSTRFNNKVPRTPATHVITNGSANVPAQAQGTTGRWAKSKTYKTYKTYKSDNLLYSAHV